MRKRLASVLLGGLVLCAHAERARGDETPGSPSEPEDPVVSARREFNKGAELVKSERWAEALDSFERAAKVKTHAVTSFNIAQCERALGQYTRARRSFREALKLNEGSGNVDLPESASNEAKGLLAELEHILARADVALQPIDAAVAIDGRPLERVDDEDGKAVFVAGTALPAPGTAPSLANFRVVMNPGPHVVTVSRRGYQDVVVNRTFSPGSTANLNLELDRLPATMHVTSNLADAIVHVNDADMGNPPVEVSRSAGRYHVTVARRGYLTYETDVTVRAGERLEIDAALREEKRALTQQWWFWTAAGAVLVGAGVTVYFLTRSDPQPTRPPVDGGGLGWSLNVP
jgi:tetratricopeptide (TPR) repeat protein